MKRLHAGSTLVLSAAMVVIGAVLLVSTLVRGGGALAVGIVMGVLFMGAGAARFYLQVRGPRA
ncbi:MAG: hypothetical protein ACR2NH_12965 [Solirubrobacteraceae bacterium]